MNRTEHFERAEGWLSKAISVINEAAKLKDRGDADGLVGASQLALQVAQVHATLACATEQRPAPTPTHTWVGVKPEGVDDPSDAVDVEARGGAAGGVVSDDEVWQEGDTNDL